MRSQQVSLLAQFAEFFFQSAISITYEDIIIYLFYLPGINTEARREATEGQKGLFSHT